MEVSTCKCLISIFLAVTLCQAAGAVEQIGLLPCIEGGSGSMLHCIEYDSVGDMSYLHDNITRRITVKLPLLVLTQLWLNQGEIAIVDVDGVVINNGQEFIRSQDRDRWTTEFNFHQVNSNYGKVHLILHIKDVDYLDHQLLHVEIRTEDNIFSTREKYWFPVQVNSNYRDKDHKGEAITPQHPAAEDLSAILRARVEKLENKTEVLQQQLMATKNDLSHSQTKFISCLEAKDDMEGIVALGTKGKNGLDITTLVIFLLGTCLVMACMVFMFKGSKLKTTSVDDIRIPIQVQPNSAVNYEKFSGGKLRFTIQNELL